MIHNITITIWDSEKRIKDSGEKGLSGDYCGPREIEINTRDGAVEDINAAIIARARELTGGLYSPKDDIANWAHGWHDEHGVWRAAGHTTAAETVAEIKPNQYINKSKYLGFALDNLIAIESVICGIMAENEDDLSLSPRLRMGNIKLRKRKNR